MKLNSVLPIIKKHSNQVIVALALLAGFPCSSQAVLNWSSFGDVPTASVTFSSNPAAISWGAGRLDVFGRGADNTLYHNYYDSNSWQGWTQMSGVFYGNPAVSSWAPNRLHVAVRGGSNHCYLNYYDGTGWQGWEDLGGSLASDPVMVSWAVGRLDIFARDSNNVLIHKWYDGTWHDWTNDTSSGAFNGTPAVVSWGTDHIEVAVRGGSNYCYTNRFNGTAWQGWQYVGGSLASDPVMVSWGEGRLDIFARDTSNCLTHAYYDGSWNGWETLSAAFSGTPAVASREQYLLDVVVRGTSNDCLQLKFNGTAWGTTWNSLGGNFVSDPIVAPVGGGRQNSGGRQDVFCVNNSNVMQTCSWQGGPIGFFKQSGEYYKDFHLYKSGSDYHLFSNVGIADGTQEWTQSGNEKEFVHATTTDFNTWSVESRVIPVRSGLWDASVVSAPSIQLFNGTYYMMYTGFGPASNGYLQRVGYATSTDLYSWTRISNATYAPPSWAQSTTDCRDSHIIRDGSQWVMYTCVQHNDGSGAVSIDTSSDLNSWTNQGWAAKKSGVALESPFVFQNGSKWFLFTSSSGVGAYSATSPTATSWTPLSSFSFLPNCYAYEFVNTGSGWVAGAFSWKLYGNHLKFWKVEFDANGDPFIDY